MDWSTYLDGFKVDQGIDSHGSGFVVRFVGLSTEACPSASEIC